MGGYPLSDPGVTPMPPVVPTGRTRRLAAYALIVCALATAAAVLSFVNGNWLGVVWVLMAGLSSNMAWYYVKKSRLARERRPERAEREEPTPCTAARAAD